MSEAAATIDLTILGTDAAVCVGDTCAVPSHPEQRLINRRVDDDQV